MKAKKIRRKNNNRTIATRPRLKKIQFCLPSSFIKLEDKFKLKQKAI
jgi:hypothetical protein